MTITATQLYNAVQCPHRVALDAHGNPAERDEPNAFIEMLWEQGITHESNVIASIGVTADMTVVPENQRQALTLDAMRRGEPLIYGGLIAHGDMIGIPDLLKLRGNGYTPGDVKAGSGCDGDEEEGKLKKHYAVQVSHYTNILEGLNLSDGSREPFIVDRTFQEIPYPLSAPQGVRNTVTWWDSYQTLLAEVRGLLNGTKTSRGAMSSSCKLCHWYSHCKADMIASNDLTLIAELGRSKRDTIAQSIPTVAALAKADPKLYFDGGKTVFPGIGRDTLVKFHDRAKLLSTPNAVPYLKKSITLPIAAREVYFDIEADPMRDVVYLHGFVERPHAQPAQARFAPFFADGVEPACEEAVFAHAWRYLNERVLDSIVYYYSPYERTAYKKLARKYPAVCSVAEVEALFGLPAMVDLYIDVVKKCTEWPTYDQSIKTLAVYLGFQWRDSHPSGAASIEWYNRWIETGDPAIKQRILDYNEDDCLATGVVVDGVRQLKLSASAGQSN
jgi:uncharacterized protein